MFIASKIFGLSLLSAPDLNSHFPEKIEAIRRKFPQASTKMSIHILCIPTSSRDEISILSVSPLRLLDPISLASPKCLVSPPPLLSMSYTIHFSLSVGSFLSGFRHTIISPTLKRNKSTYFDLILPTSSLLLLPWQQISWLISSFFPPFCLECTQSGFCPHPSAETVLSNVISNFHVSKSNGQFSLMILLVYQLSM